MILEPDRGDIKKYTGLILGGALIQWFTSEKGVHLFRYFQSLMRTLVQATTGLVLAQFGVWCTH